MPWSKSFEVGVPELDADHRRLVALINEACLAFRANQGERLMDRLEALRALAAEHFEREEAVLGRIPRSGLLETHSLEHGRRLDQLGALCEACHRSGGRPDGVEVGKELIDWFVKQAIGHDARIKAYFT